MFEQRYTQANDRIHPRKDLLEEMQKKWAAEEAARAEAEKKTVRFPAWARFVSAAAGILLCVGLGMGAMLLFSKTRGRKPAVADMSAEAEAPQMAYSLALETEEEPKIVTGADMDLEEPAPEAAEPETMLTAAAPAEERPQGMHAARDEAEVEDAVRSGSRDAGGLFANDDAADALTEGAEAAPEGDTLAKKAEGAPAEALAPGKVIRREDLMAVFMPTTEQLHVLRRENNKLETVFSLGLRTKDAQVKDVFWLGSQLLTVQEKDGDTELLRFDVTDWAAPRHLLNLTQSGAFLAAMEAGGKLLLLSRYEASAEEPFPWVGEQRIDFAQVLIDDAQPGNLFTVITVYDPAIGEIVRQGAVLLPAEGALAEGDRLILWTAGENPRMYLFQLGEDGIVPVAERTLSGRVAAVAPAKEGLELLLEHGGGLELLLAVDESLTEGASAAAAPETALKDFALGQGSAAFLTEDSLHVLTAVGDRTLAILGDRLAWLAEDRLLVISAEGRLQVIATDGELREQWTIPVREDLSLLLEEPDRAAFDPATGRLVFPAGPRMFQYTLVEGQPNPRGVTQDFRDHSALEQRELRCLLLEDRAVIFYKAGAMLCNERFERMNTRKY